MEPEGKAVKKIATKKTADPDYKKKEDEQKQNIDIIEQVYFNDHTGYRSIQETLKQARAIDASITDKTVKVWKATLEAKKTKDSGYNSFIANAPFEEFQVDQRFFIGRRAGNQI